MAPFSPAILRGASAGNAGHLQAILTGLDANNCNLAALNAIVVNFDLEVPQELTPDPARRVSGRPALLCLTQITMHLAKRNDIREAAVAKILEKLDGIVAWNIFCALQVLEHGHAGLPSEMWLAHSASVFLQLMKLDVSLQKAICASPKAVQFILMMWNYPIPNSDEYIIDREGDPFCPIIAVMCYYTRLWGVAAPLSEFLFASTSASNAACDALVSRVTQVLTLTQVDAIGGNLGHMIEITTSFVRNPTLHARLRKKRFLESWARAVCTTYKRILPGFSLYIVDSIMKLIFAPGATLWRGVDHILGAGFLETAVTCLAEHNFEVRDDVFGAAMLKWQSLMYYPRTIVSLMKAWEAMPEMYNTVAKAIDGKRQFYDAREFGREQLEIYKGMRERPVYICDNDLKTGQHELVQPKTCSGCHTVVYCSEACQADDWVQRHRRECLIMRHTHHDRREEKGHYTYDMRQFHLRSIETDYNTARLGCTYDQFMKPNVPATQQVMMVDRAMGVSPTSLGSESLREREMHGKAAWVLLEQYVRAEGAGDCPAMDTRVRECVRAFHEQPVEPGTEKRLVEVDFAWTIERRVVVLVELTRVPAKNTKWEIKKNVVRIVRSENCDRAWVRHYGKKVIPVFKY